MIGPDRPLNTEEVRQLTGFSECYLHVHPRHVIDADDVTNSQSARKIIEVSANYTVLPTDEIVLVDTTAGNVTIMLPHSDFKKEFQVVKVSSANKVIILPTSPDTILDDTGVEITSVFTSLNFKMDTDRRNWILI